eukprot:3610084-Pyramimonas_sp.AAC.1
MAVAEGMGRSRGGHGEDFEWGRIDVRRASPEEDREPGMCGRPLKSVSGTGAPPATGGAAAWTSRATLVSTMERHRHVYLNARQ